VNLVADCCKAEVDIRLPQGTQCKDVLSEIGKMRAQHKGLEYKIIDMIEANHTSPSEEIIQLMTRNAEAVRGGRIFLSSALGFTDCRCFRQKGIPAGIYGPLSYHMGSQDEHITVADLLDTVKVHVLTSFDYLGYLD